MSDRLLVGGNEVTAALLSRGFVFPRDGCRVLIVLLGLKGSLGAVDKAHVLDGRPQPCLGSKAGGIVARNNFGSRRFDFNKQKVGIHQLTTLFFYR